MSTFYARFAERTFLINCINQRVGAFFKDYLTDSPGENAYVIETAPEDIAYERRKSEENGEKTQFSDAYMEFIAVCRIIAERIVDEGVILFHGSALSIDGNAIIFTAPSGTGKSTHARLWREKFGERVTMINDDKPFLMLKETEGGRGVFVCGSPWCGKHRLGTDTVVPFKAICFIERNAENSIEPVTGDEMLPFLIKQTYVPREGGDLLKTLEVDDWILKNIPLYRLKCNMDPQAAEVAYAAMIGGKR